MRWSFSASRTFRRCPRQFYYGQIAAYHSARKDPLRREAFLLKQRKSLPLWRGNLVHSAIENFVVPEWRAGRQPDWDAVVQALRETAKRQVAFSAAGRYREDGMTKSKAGDDYCALVGHEDTLSDVDIAASVDEAELALRNLSEMTDLISEIVAHNPLFAELRVPVTYDTVSVNAMIDLLYFRQYGHPTIVEWKTYEGTVGDSELQGALYAWALQNSPKWRVESPEAVQILEVQLLKSAVVRHDVTADSLISLEDTIFRSVSEIRAIAGDGKYANVDIREFPVTRNAVNCQYCSFQTLCSHQLRAANEAMPGELAMAANG